MTCRTKPVTVPAVRVQRSREPRQASGHGRQAPPDRRERRHVAGITRTVGSCSRRCRGPTAGAGSAAQPRLQCANGDGSGYPDQSGRAVTAGTPSGIMPDVQALADVTSPEKMVVQISASTPAAGICTAGETGVSRAGGNLHAQKPGVSDAGQRMRVHSSTGSGAGPKMHVQKAVVRGVRQKNARAKNHVNAARRGMHVQASGGSEADGKWHVHFSAARVSAQRMRVQVRDGSHIGRNMHASAGGGSAIGRAAHEPHRGRDAAVPGLHESRTSGSENFQDGWAQKISRIPAQKKFA
jgi:hypothetical protein